MTSCAGNGVVTVTKLPSLNIHKFETIISQHDPFPSLFKQYLRFFPYRLRDHIVACLGELIGTIFFYFISFAGIQVAFSASPTLQHVDKVALANLITPEVILYIALSSGLSLAVATWVFWRISGGLFNPAVTLGMTLIGALTLGRGILLCIVQTAGVIIAAYMANAIFPGELTIGTSLHPKLNLGQGIVIEMLLTTLLVLTILVLAGDKHEVTILAPVAIGLSVFVGQLFGVFWTGGSMNPARSLAPAIVTRSFPSEHWIYWVGPIAGSILAALLHRLMKALEAECTDPTDEIKAQPPLLPTTNQDSTIELPSGGAALSSVEESGHAPSVPLNTPVPMSEYASKKFEAQKEEERTSRTPMTRATPTTGNSGPPSTARTTPTTPGQGPEKSRFRRSKTTGETAPAPYWGDLS